MLHKSRRRNDRRFVDGICHIIVCTRRGAGDNTRPVLSELDPPYAIVQRPRPRRRIRGSPAALGTTDRKIAAIALDCDFNDLSNFSLAFRAEFRRCRATIDRAQTDRGV